MNLNKIKILLVGKGYWGNIWYKTIFKKNIDFVVVDKILKTSIDTNGIKNFELLEDALNAEEFTHAIIASPSENHLEIFKQINIKIPEDRILIEKPCGSSIEDFKDNVEFFPGYLFLYSEPFKYIRENISMIGDPIMYRSTRASMGPQPRTDISVVADYLIHDLYIFAELFGYDDIEILSSHPQKHFDHSVKADTISLQLKNKNIFADMFSSWWYPTKHREVIITGKSGTFLWINDTLRYYKNSYKETKNIDRNGNIRYDLFHSDARDIILTEKLTVDSELEHFLNRDRFKIHSNQVWKLINKIENKNL